MPSLRLGILATIGYVAIVGLGTFALFLNFGTATDIRGAMLLLFPVQLLAVLFCLLIVARHRGWRSFGFGVIDWSGTIWFLPAWIVLAYMFWDIAIAVTVHDLRALGVAGLSLLVITTLLIAFGEEVLFRGILLRGAMTKLSLPLAMLLSTVVFSLFHYVNAFSGQTVGDTSQQVLFASIVGFFLAPIAVRIGNLWPLIIWHWWWNIAVILGPVTGLLHPLVLSGIAVQSVISVLLWAEMVRVTRAH